MVRNFTKLLSFFVSGSAIPKQSFQMGAGGKGFTKESVVSWAEYVSTAANIAMREHMQRFNQPFETGYLAVELRFILDHGRKVDLDNLSKCVLDAMNGIVYKDDSQVIDLHPMKFWNFPPAFPGKESVKVESPAVYDSGPAGVEVFIYRVEL